MGLAPIKSTRIYEEIIRQVKQMISEGRLKSGDRLPPERDLAEKFVVSRTSVREALRALEPVLREGGVDDATVRDLEQARTNLQLAYASAVGGAG